MNFEEIFEKFDRKLREQWRNLSEKRTGENLTKIIMEIPT